MLRKLIQACAAILVCSILTTSVAGATGLPINSVVIGPDGSHWYEASQADKVEGEFLKEFYDSILNQKPSTSQVEITAQAWPGQYQLHSYPMAHSPTQIFWGDQRTGIWLNIAGLALSIGGVYVKSVYLVVASVAASLAQTVNEVSNSQTTARVGHSYRYLVKEGRVFTVSGWMTYYTSISRQWFSHDYAIYIDTNNFTRQNAVDNFGDGPFNTNWAPNYSNNNHIELQALNRWYYNLSPGMEDWNGVRPDPDPQRSIPEAIEGVSSRS